jgi:hypothetical protein
MADFDNTNRGILFPNDRKTSDKHPNFKGSIYVGGKEYWLSAWSKTNAKGEFISLSVEPKEAEAGATKPAVAGPAPTRPASVPARATQGFAALDETPPF